MRKRPPSVVHLARLWRSTPQEVADQLIKTWISAPQFSYRILYTLAEKALKGELPYSQFEQAILDHEPRESIQKILLEVLPLLHGHFLTLHPAFVLPLEARSYVVSNSLIIPFSPPLIFGDQFGTVIPWFIFWKHNPLHKEQIALANTLSLEVISQDPDLADADFSLHDFSEEIEREGRTLRITSRSNLPILQIGERNEMLEIFAAGHELALAQYPAIKAALQERKQKKAKAHLPKQLPPDLFDS